MEAIAEQLTQARADGVLIVAQSNAGLPQLVGDRFEYDAPPDELAHHARALQSARRRPHRRVLRLDPRAAARWGRALGV